ncbi:hypothetical protein SNEBB_001783 [Seison nebaliae]|nr:hypothetical protein SNEBB_001783 [Seison nebaliae]
MNTSDVFPRNFNSNNKDYYQPIKEKNSCLNQSFPISTQQHESTSNGNLSYFQDDQLNGSQNYYHNQIKSDPYLNASSINMTTTISQIDSGYNNGILEADNPPQFTNNQIKINHSQNNNYYASQSTFMNPYQMDNNNNNNNNNNNKMMTTEINNEQSFNTDDNLYSTYQSDQQLVETKYDKHLSNNLFEAPPQSTSQENEMKRNDSYKKLMNSISPTGNAYDDFEDFLDDASSKTSHSRSSRQSSNIDKQDRRKLNHKNAEQKRRLAITNGFQNLSNNLPKLKEDNYVASSQRITKAKILNHAIKHIQGKKEELGEIDKEIEKLQIELEGVEILQKTYKEMLDEEICDGTSKDNLDVEEKKYDIFGNLILLLNEDFHTTVDTSTYALLTSSSIRWLQKCLKKNDIETMLAGMLK